MTDPEHPHKQEIMDHMAERTAHWYIQQNTSRPVNVSDSFLLIRKTLGFECTPDNNFPGEGWYRATRQVIHLKILRIIDLKVSSFVCCNVCSASTQGLGNRVPGWKACQQNHGSFA